MSDSSEVVAVSSASLPCSPARSGIQGQCSEKSGLYSRRSNKEAETEVVLNAESPIQSHFKYYSTICHGFLSYKIFVLNRPQS